MNTGSIDPDRDLLGLRKALWSDDPDEIPTEAELDRLSAHFGKSGKSGDLQLRAALKTRFQIFFVNAVDESFQERDGCLEKVSKPSTRVMREIGGLSDACQVLCGVLANLDPLTRRWLKRSLKQAGTMDRQGEPVRFHDFEEHLCWQLDHLIHSARVAEGLATRGPNNMALRMMVEEMADCWESCHGKPPTTDKGRGNRDQPFLTLCQEMAQIAHKKLRAKGGCLSTLKLDGIVADVLKERREQTS